MWGLLRLLVQHVVIGVTNKRSVVRVEEHLVRNLEGMKSTLSVDNGGKKSCTPPQVRPGHRVSHNRELFYGLPYNIVEGTLVTLWLKSRSHDQRTVCVTTNLSSCLTVLILNVVPLKKTN